MLKPIVYAFNQGSIRRYLPVLKNLAPVRGMLAVTVCFSLLAAGFEGLGLGLIIPFLQSLTEPQATLRTGWDWVDQVVFAVDAPQAIRLYHVSALILVSTYLRSLFSYLGQIASIKATETLIDSLRCQVFDQLQSVSLSYYANTRSGEIINSLTTEIQRFKYLLSVLAFALVRGTLLLAYAAAIFALSWQMSCLALTLFGLLSLSLTSLLKWIRQSGDKVSKANGHFTGVAAELISGIRTTLSFGAQDFEQQRFRSASQALAQANTEGDSRAALLHPLSEAVATTILLFVIGLATQLLIQTGSLSPAKLLAFLFALFRLMPIVQQLNGVRGQVAVSESSIENLSALLRRDDKPYLQDGKQALPHFQESIRFEDVDFAYQSGKQVLTDINVELRCGTTTALVGASGAGKSTLVDLLMRFYDPTSGRIVLDGTDLREYQITSLRKKMAIVSQETFIFNNTVRDNIAYATPEASFERVYEAARKANALEFIEQLPEGFDTVLGDRGVLLSGGQRQRLAIARALLRDPEILILDEATSALDSVSEKLVQGAIENLMRDRTVVVIAHRLSTIENADWVVVLDSGRIVEQGKYRQLLEQKGALWKYHSLQYQVPA